MTTFLQLLEMLEGSGIQASDPLQANAAVLSGLKHLQALGLAKTGWVALGPYKLPGWTLTDEGRDVAGRLGYGPKPLDAETKEH